jgi:hypothetical protein
MEDADAVCTSDLCAHPSKNQRQAGWLESFGDEVRSVRMKAHQRLRQVNVVLIGSQKIESLFA